jgi:low affinity Fe/Cu permease
MLDFRNRFHHFAIRIGQVAGSPWAFLGSILIIVAWGITGPVFGFSDTWQLVINTSTTIVTFLMVFLIQNSQNRDMKAMHLKLDELIYHMKGARNSLINLEDLTEEELERLQQEFAHLATVNEQMHHKGRQAIVTELKKRQGKTKHPK